MKESIIIKNFGPIKDVEITDIKSFTLFIGESGSGKSTIIKIIVLFRWIYKMLCIRSYLKYANISKSPFQFDFQLYLKNNGFSDYILKQTPEIIYKKGSTTIHFKKALRTSNMVPKEELSLEKMVFISEKRNVIPDLLSGNKLNLGFFLNETFSDFLEASEFIKNLPINYLGVDFMSEKKHSDTKYFIYDQHSNFKINLEDASSGTQTLIPLSLIIEYYSQHYDFNKNFNATIFNYLSKNDSLSEFRASQNIGAIQNKNIHIHIEEPELSLYPESQRSLLNFIVNKCFIAPHSDYNMSVMMATHSPYIINHINLLIKAYDTNKTIEGAKLNYENIGVYHVVDGQILPLKMLNERLINTNILSETINNIYDQYNEL